MRELPDLKLLVCGSRTCHDNELIWETLDGLTGNFKLTVIEGGQKKWCDEHDHFMGADYWAHMWALANKDKCIHRQFPADWNGPLKRGAGYARNAQMDKEGLGSEGLRMGLGFVDKPLVESKGTFNMVKLMMANPGVVVRVHQVDEWLTEDVLLSICQ